MTGSTPALFIPMISESAVRDAVADQSFLPTSSHQHLHFNGSVAESHDHPKSEILSNHKNRHERINILHLLRRQLIKIASHNFYAMQRRNKQSEIRHNVRDDNEMKHVSGCNGSSDDSSLRHHCESICDKSENSYCDRENDESYRFQPTPAVYQDPYCAVTVDRKVHVYGYYVQSNQFIDLSFYYNAQSTRTVYADDIAAMFYTDNDNDGQLTSNNCRTWGLSRNSVWWAADPTRNDSVKKMCLVVLQLKEHPILIGFTVIKLVAFINALKICGLNRDCKFISSLPAIAESDASGTRTDEVNKKETKTPGGEVCLEDNIDENSK